MTSLKKIGICYKCQKTYSVKTVKAHIQKCKKEYEIVELELPEDEATLKRKIEIMLYLRGMDHLYDDPQTNPDVLYMPDYIDRLDGEEEPDKEEVAQARLLREQKKIHSLLLEF